MMLSKTVKKINKTQWQKNSKTKSGLKRRYLLPSEPSNDSQGILKVMLESVMSFV